MPGHDVTNSVQIETALREHLDLAVDRHQAGFDLKRRMVLAHLLAEFRHGGPVRLGLDLLVGHLFGAIAAPFVVERMSDHGFRRWTRAIIFTIAVVYLIRGGLLLWQGASG